MSRSATAASSLRHRRVPIRHRRVPLGHRRGQPVGEAVAFGREPVPALGGRCQLGGRAVPLPLRHRDGAPGRGQLGVERPGALPFGRERRRGLGRDQLRRPYLTFGVARPGRRGRRRRVGLFGPAARGAELLGGAQCLAGGRRRPLDGLGPLLARPLRLVLRPAGQTLGPLLRLLGRQALGLGLRRAAVGGLDRAHGVRLDLRQPRGDPGQRGYQRLHRRAHRLHVLPQPFGIERERGA